MDNMLDDKDSTAATGMRDCEGGAGLTRMQDMLRPRGDSVAVRPQICMNFLLKGYIAHDHTH